MLAPTPARDHDVVQAVLVDVEHQAGRLLLRRARGRQVTRLAGEMRPPRVFPASAWAASKIKPTREGNEGFIANLRAIRWVSKEGDSPAEKMATGFKR